MLLCTVLRMSYTLNVLIDSLIKKKTNKAHPVVSSGCPSLHTLVQACLLCRYQPRYSTDHSLCSIALV